MPDLSFAIGFTSSAKSPPASGGNGKGYRLDFSDGAKSVKNTRSAAFQDQFKFLWEEKR